MVVSSNLRRIRNDAFNQALVVAESRIAMVNAAFILLALGFKGTVHDYLIIAAYISCSVALLYKGMRILVMRHFRIGLPLVDLIVTGYMIYRTGGITSPLYPFLLIPVLVAMVRGRYIGIITWTTAAAMTFVGAALVCGGTLEPVTILIKVSCLYLFGISGGFLINRTYQVAWETSDQLVRRNADLKRLTGDLNRVSGSIDMNQIFDNTLRIIQQYNFAPKLAVMLFDDRGDLRTVKTEGWTEEEINGYNHYPLTKYSIFLATMMAFHKPAICPAVKNDAELARTFNKMAIKSLWLFPLVIRGEILGGVALADLAEREISEEDRDILTNIVNQAVNAIQNVICLTDEKKRADTDSLTGLYNYGYFAEQLKKLVRSHLRQGLPLSLMMLDIDNFKKYNDLYGHPAGDCLIKKVAGSIIDNVRSQDIAVRYGGEEFSVIMPNCDQASALVVAERIRKTVERIWDLKMPVTVSVGVGTISDQAGDVATFVEFVDRSLYFAKTTGKNRVCSGSNHRSLNEQFRKAQC